MMAFALLTILAAAPQPPPGEGKPDVRASVVQMRPWPPFPDEAIAEGRQDLVIADVSVDDRGKVTAVHVLRGRPEFAKQVSLNVAKWRYKPATLEAKTVGDTVPLVVPFVWGQRADKIDNSSSWNDVLVAALTDPNEEVRIRSVGYVGTIPLPLQKEQALALLKRAEQDQSVTVQRLAHVYITLIENAK